MPTSRRRLALAVLVSVCAASKVAAAGWMERTGPPELRDEGRAPTDEQAVATVRRIVAALQRKREQPIYRLVAIPYSQYLKGPVRGGASEGCFQSERFISEGEGLPGAPNCLVAGLAKYGAALVAAMDAAVVFPTLAALEEKEGKLVSPTRKLLRPLRQHRLVVVKVDEAAGGPVRLVVAVRKEGGEPRVDAFFAEVPPKAPAK